MPLPLSATEIWEVSSGLIVMETLVAPACKLLSISSASVWANDLYPVSRMENKKFLTFTTSVISPTHRSYSRTHKQLLSSTPPLGEGLSSSASTVRCFLCLAKLFQITPRPDSYGAT